MQITLSPELERFVQQEVAEGKYASAEEALADAVDYLRWRSDFQKKLQIGLDQAARGELIPGEEVFAEIRQRLRDKIAAEEST